MKRDVLKKMLVKAKAEITDCNVYDVADADNAGALMNAVSRHSDGIFFMSPRAVDVFFKLVPKPMAGELKKSTAFYSIGPVTTRALKKKSVKHVLSAEKYTVDGLVEKCLEGTISS
ncbi:MAG: uroporphyrinogen-III synthase [Candidatus Omnitrophica bacterium]|nr:uroporphyrinogen-III synthase [Candidatus Omnitrophota bacterium]